MDRVRYPKRDWELLIGRAYRHCPFCGGRRNRKFLVRMYRHRPLYWVCGDCGREYEGRVYRGMSIPLTSREREMNREMSVVFWKHLPSYRWLLRNRYFPHYPSWGRVSFDSRGMFRGDGDGI